MLGAMEGGSSWPWRIVGGAAGGARPAGGTERHSCGQCPWPPRRGLATAARWGLISSFESRGGNRAAPGPPPSPEWRGRPQRRAHPGNRHHTGLGDTGRRDRGRDRGLKLTPAMLAGSQPVHALQDCCPHSQRRKKRGGLQLPAHLGRLNMGGSALRPPPTKGRAPWPSAPTPGPARMTHFLARKDTTCPGCPRGHATMKVPSQWCHHSSATTAVQPTLAAPSPGERGRGGTGKAWGEVGGALELRCWGAPDGFVCSGAQRSCLLLPTMRWRSLAPWGTWGAAGADPAHGHTDRCACA